MSELKIYKRSEILKGYWFTEYCRMDEADAVIAEKYRELSHQKYKRCLNKAKLCEMSARELDTRMRLPDKWKFTKHEEYLYFVGYYHKWHEYWLKIAEKFKEVK